MPFIVVLFVASECVYRIQSLCIKGYLRIP